MPISRDLTPWGVNGYVTPWTGSASPRYPAASICSSRNPWSPRNRCYDARKDMARHHAIGVYRIIAMITPEEDSVVRALAATHLDHPKVVEARRVVGEHFAAPDSLGILRLREHQLFFGRMDLNRFRVELSAILPPLAT